MTEIGKRSKTLVIWPITLEQKCCDEMKRIIFSADEFTAQFSDPYTFTDIDTGSGLVVASRTQSSNYAVCG